MPEGRVVYAAAMSTGSRVRAPELHGRGGFVGGDPLSLATSAGGSSCSTSGPRPASTASTCWQELARLVAPVRRRPDVSIGVHSPEVPHETEHAAVARGGRAARHRLTRCSTIPSCAPGAKYAVRAWPTLVLDRPRGVVFVPAGLGRGARRALWRRPIDTLLAAHQAKGTLVRGRAPRRCTAPVAPSGLRFPGGIAHDAAARSAGDRRQRPPLGSSWPSPAGRRCSPRSGAACRAMPTAPTRPPRSSARRASASGAASCGSPTPATGGSAGSTSTRARSRRSARRRCARPGTSPRSPTSWWSRWPARTSSGRWTSTAAASGRSWATAGRASATGRSRPPSWPSRRGSRSSGRGSGSSTPSPPPCGRSCRGPTTWSWPPRSAPGCSTGATATASGRRASCSTRSDWRPTRPRGSWPTPSTTASAATTRGTVG